jgi:hypothetical protein
MPTKNRILMKVRRGIEYNATFKEMVFRATVRVYLKSVGLATKDLAIVRIRSKTRDGLEKKIKNIQSDFNKLLHEDPDYLKKIGQSEIFELEDES